MIILDPRRGSGELEPYFKPYDISVTVSQLDFGDCCFNGNGPDGVALVGVERKVIRDLIASMRDKRLSGHQLPGLLNTYQFVYLIVEGIWHVGANGEIEVRTRRGRKFGWTPLRMGSRPVLYREVDHYLTTLTHICGITVYPTSTPQQTVALIASRYHWFNDKVWSQHDSHQEIYAPYEPAISRGRVFGRTPSLTEKFAAQIPGIDKGAFDIAKYFGSVNQMVSAGVGEWEKVVLSVHTKDGVKKHKIGRVRAERIYNDLRRG